tara:strand:- start:60 stop:1133 length:1074 start_codon:yes stop_codon:yes gene_type:complete
VNEIRNLISISRYAGERFDLIQAGGGNTSVKFPNGQMQIKASGMHLTDMCELNGIAKIDNGKIKIFLEDVGLKVLSKRERARKAQEVVDEASFTPEIKASIETFLHVLTFKYTLHTHPIVVNIVACRKDWRESFLQLFPSALCVSYETPGIDLAMKMKEELENYTNDVSEIPKIIFLQNHGLIISSNNVEETKALTDKVVLDIEKYLGVDYSAYRMTNQVSELINSILNEKKIAYLSSDSFIMEVLAKDESSFFLPPFCPDKLVYCGASCIKLKKLQDQESIKDHMVKHGDYPKVVLHDNMIFFIADSIRKAREIEEVLKFHLITMTNNDDGRINYLSKSEIQYLNNWDAEKYRQKL